MLLKELNKLFTTLFISWYYEFAWNYSLSFWLLFPSLHSRRRTLAAWTPTAVTTTAKQGSTTTTGNRQPNRQRKKKRTGSAQRARPITKTAGTTGLAKGEPAIHPAVWIARFVAGQNKQNQRNLKLWSLFFSLFHSLDLSGHSASASMYLLSSSFSWLCCL